MDVTGFESLAQSLGGFSPRPEILLEEVPAPQKLAAFSYALSADVSNGFAGDEEDEIASGRFVLLHEPGGQDTWDGEFRCVTFIRADVDPVMQEDTQLTEIGWKWFLDSLTNNRCEFTAASGTVTRVASSSFGKLSGRSDEAEMEIRASWTPIMKNPSEIIDHIAGWCNLLAEISGLTPIPEGISALPRNRR